MQLWWLLIFYRNGGTLFRDTSQHTTQHKKLGKTMVNINISFYYLLKVTVSSIWNHLPIEHLGDQSASHDVLSETLLAAVGVIRLVTTMRVYEFQSYRAGKLLFSVKSDNYQFHTITVG